MSPPAREFFGQMAADPEAWIQEARLPGQQGSEGNWLDNDLIEGELEPYLTPYGGGQFRLNEEGRRLARQSAGE